MKTWLAAFAVGVVALGAGIIVSNFALAAAGGCGQYGSGKPAPTGFAQVKRIFTQSSDPLLYGECSGETLSVYAGNSSQTLVWHTGFSWSGNEWVAHEYAGTPHAQSSQWITGTAQKNISRPQSGSKYVIAYVCEYSSTGWHCGCADTQCHTKNRWAVQRFTREGVIDTSGPECGNNQCQEGETPVSCAVDCQAHEDDDDDIQDDDDDIVQDDDDDNGSGVSGPACGEGELLWSSTPSAANIGATGIWFFNSSQWNVLHHSNAGNISIAAAPDNSPAIRVRMVEGEHHGGAVETRPLTSNVPQTACLEYKMYLESDYELDTQGGGKFPGLFGGSYAPRGCVAGSGDTILGRGQAWSMRAGWTGSEQYKLYAYYHNKTPSCGVNMLTVPGRMPGGRWVTYAQEVHVNDVGQQNGYVKLWRDGQLIGQQSNITFRLINGALPDGIYFDIYAGGSTGVFPKDQNVYFKDFKMYGPASQ